MKGFGRLMHVDIFIITNDIVETSNKISFQWVIGSRIYDEIIYDLRVDDFIGVLVKDEFAKLLVKTKQFRRRTSKP